MPATTFSPPTARDQQRAGFDWSWLGSGEGLALLALGVAWLWLFNVLSDTWQTDPQYNYGYLVPFLGGMLLWRRWPDRPPAVPTPIGGLKWLAGGLVLLQLPLSLVLESNPGWPLVCWMSGAQVMGLTLVFLDAVGGAKWVRHFGPALGFMLVAVPWPSNLEFTVVQGLMRLVTGLTVNVADLLGIPAVQQGNLIQISTGVVGIDEACSGVRSLQSALMIACFLGELHRFSWPRRGVLLGASFLLVLVANLGRTTTLVWLAAHQGLSQMAAWHDTIGLVVMVIVLPSLLGLARLLQPPWTRVDALVEVTTRDFPGRARRLPRWAGLAMLGWWLAVQGVTEFWYRSHEFNIIDTPRWSVVWPVGNPEFQASHIPETSLALLRCSSSEAANWGDAAGNRWSGFLLRWNPGKNSEQKAMAHRPELCFPATGARLLEDYGEVPLMANGIELPFHHLSFECDTRIIHVFFCLWAERMLPHEAPLLQVHDRSNRMGRLAAVANGKRYLGAGQKVLEVTVQGPETSEAATALVKGELARLVKPN